MNLHTQIEVKGKSYLVKECENSYMIHPRAFGIAPVWKDDSEFDYWFDLVVEDYKISLRSMWVQVDCALPRIDGVAPRPLLRDGKEGYVYEGLHLPLLYSGAVLITNSLLKTEKHEEVEENPAIYCYRNTYEYIFENGILVTSVDHSRDMLRIRKNLDLGYRSLDKKRDVKCIQRFLKSSFVGNYKEISNKKLESYLQKMKSLYQETISFN